MPVEATKEGSPQQQSLTARAAWVMLAKTLAFVFAFALPLLLVRRLDQTTFGLYKQVFLLVDTSVSMLALGFGMSAFYFLPREPERRHQVVFNILLFLTTVGGLVCLVLALRPDLVVRLLNAPPLAELAPLVGLVIMLWMISYFLETIVVANQELRLASALIVGSRLTKSLFLIAAAISFPSVRALVYAAILQGVLQVCVLLVYLRSRFGRFWRGFEWAMMRRQIAYVLPLGISAELFLAYSYLDNYFVSHRFDSATYAIYAIGCFNIPLVGILSDAIGQVMIPRLSYLQKENRRREIVELVARMMRKLAFVFLPLYAFLLVVARDFITLLFTEQYLASWPIFAINLTLVPLAILASANDPVMRAYAEHRFFLLRVRVALLVVFVGAVWFGVGRYGLVGAITAAIAVNFLERMITAHKAARILGVRRTDASLFKDVGKLALAAAVAGLAAWFLRSFLADATARPFVVLAACGSLFSIVYLAAVVLFDVPTAEERARVRRRFTRSTHNGAPEERAASPLV
ncbi:MAG TPA: oligosaccharide flippase family protein [Pyrinomonadaceae bacterium]|nr:oligosaccharide flippase family protein [Pyrinomonadaceae bacterium]